MTRASSERSSEAPRLGVLVVRFVLGLLALLTLVTILGRMYRAPLESLGRAFVDSYGIPGMAVGTLLADGFLFPVPPQFYMLLATTTEVSDAEAMVGIGLGSVAGGFSGYLLGRWLSNVAWLRRRLTSERASKALRAKLGTRSLIALGLSPLAFSWLTYFCGFSRYSWRYAALLCALRLPKLVAYYWLVRLGWTL